LTVEASAEKERVPVSRIGRLALKVHVPAGLDERHFAGIERAIKSCPAYGTLLHPPSVAISIERPGEVGTEAPADGRARRVG